MSKNKGGRPPKPINEKRSHLIAARFNESEYQSIKMRSVHAQMPVGQFVRTAALNAKIKERLSPEIRKQLISLVSMSNNTNQIARRLNSSAPVDSIEFRQLSREISRIIDNIIK